MRKEEVNNKYDPMKKRGLLSYESTQGGGDKLKEKLKEMKKKGLVIHHVDTEPATYKYTVWFYKDKTIHADLNDEVWKDMDGEFGDKYQISSLGRIRSVRTLSEIYGKCVVLTDAKGQRHNVRIAKAYKNVFGKELEKEKPSQYQLAKK